MFKLLSGFVAFILAIAIAAFLAGYFASSELEAKKPEVVQAVHK